MLNRKNSGMSPAWTIAWMGLAVESWFGGGPTSIVSCGGTKPCELFWSSGFTVSVAGAVPVEPLVLDALTCPVIVVGPARPVVSMTAFTVVVAPDATLPTLQSMVRTGGPPTALQVIGAGLTVSAFEAG